MTAVRPPGELRPIDPFAPAVGGRYADDAVVVRRAPRKTEPAGTFAVTPSFTLARDGDRLLLVHDLPETAIDNDVAALIVGELFDPGWIGGADTFERLMTGVVLTAREDPMGAWELFYRNTLRSLDALTDRPGLRASTGYDAGHGTLAGMEPVYRRAAARLAEADARSVVDLGSCFGFFPLRLMPHIPAVHATDISAGTCRLLERIARRLRTGLRVITCDAEAVPLEAGCVDAVTSLHLLEHVNERQGRRILTEAMRLARRRVIVAVPMELVPDPAYGHVRSLTPASLAATAAAVAPGWHATVEEYHGAWLVLDRPRV